MKKSLCLTLFLTLQCLCSHAATRPLLKDADSNTLLESFATGAKKITLSSTGTLEFIDGMTITGGSVLKTALGLGTMATQNSSSVSISGGSITGISNFSTLNFGAGAYLLEIGHLGTMTANRNLWLNVNNNTRTISLSGNLTTSSDATIGGTNTGDQSLFSTLAVSGQTNVVADTTSDNLTLVAGANISITTNDATDAITIATTGLVVGTNVQAYDADLMTWSGITPGANVGTFLGTPSSANLAAALTNETGSGAAVFATAPTFTGSIVVNKAGQSEAGGLEVADDVGSPSVRALYILPPANSGRIYFGKAGQGAYTVNFSNVGFLEQVPPFYVGNGMRIGDLAAPLTIARGDGGLELAASHPTDYGLDIHHTNAYSAPSDADIVANIHRLTGITVFGTHTTRTNWEGVSFAWDGARYAVKPVAGSGGGTVRPVRYWFSGTVWMGSGSGSPEGVETAGIGSIYSDTATGNVYRKTSGTGNTGWVTP